MGEHKSLDDVVMKPDKGFDKQLKALDPNLFVVWDWASSKWEIWKWRDDAKDSPPLHVMTVQTAGRSYRELGADVLISLQRFDMRKYSAKQIADYFDEADRQERRRKARDFRNKIESITFESFNFARGVLQIQVPQKWEVLHAEG